MRPGESQTYVDQLTQGELRDYPGMLRRVLSLVEKPLSTLLEASAEVKAANTTVQSALDCLSLDDRATFDTKIVPPEKMGRFSVQYRNPMKISARAGDSLALRAAVLASIDEIVAVFHQRRDGVLAHARFQGEDQKDTHGHTVIAAPFLLLDVGGQNGSFPLELVQASTPLHVQTLPAQSHFDRRFAEMSFSLDRSRNPSATVPKSFLEGVRGSDKHAMPHMRRTDGNVFELARNLLSRLGGEVIE
jgi:hypothetical protein